MAQHKFSILKYPSPVLRKKAERIGHITDEIREIMDGMVEVMRRNQGIGLAAPQIGSTLRIVVVILGDEIFRVINPKYLKTEGVGVMEEGCLSLPSITVKVKRARKVMLEYLDENGRLLKRTFEGLSAVVLQHEIDHLEGRLIIDYLPWYNRLLKLRDL